MRPPALLLAFPAVAAGTLGLAADAGGEAERHMAAAAAIGGGGGAPLAELTGGIGLGFPALIAPAHALGGETAVALFLALVAACGWVVALSLARRIVPDPYAPAGVALVALSPPAVALATASLPEAAAATLLISAALLVHGAAERPALWRALGAAALIALLPWLGGALLLYGLPLLAVLVRDLARRGRGLAALLAVEAVAGSLLAWVSVNEALYGGMTPGSGWTFDPERLERLASLWLDRDHGLLRWAPAAALAVAGALALSRSRRERVSRAVPERAAAERAAALCALLCAAGIAVAVLDARAAEGPWFPLRGLAPVLPAFAVLAAWGLQRAPRPGALLGVTTVAGTAYLLADRSGLHPPRTSAPWGPLEAAFPRYGEGSAWADALTAGLAATALALLVAEWRAWRGPPAVP